MVDVTGKAATRRLAEARCSVRTTVDPSLALSPSSGQPDLIESARFAGVLAAKQTASLIPLCHPIRLDGITVAIDLVADGFSVTAVAEITDRTGVEMEALTACATAGLVLLQPLLRLDRTSSIEDLTLWLKSGGRSGIWRREGGGREIRE